MGTQLLEPHLFRVKLAETKIKYSTENDVYGID